MVLAGGRGTRLRPVIHDRPKPMAMVGGRPFVEWILRMLQGYGVRGVVMCIGYMGERVRQYFDAGGPLGLDLAYSEDVDLGTGGALFGLRRPGADVRSSAATGMGPCAALGDPDAVGLRAPASELRAVRGAGGSDALE